MRDDPGEAGRLQAQLAMETHAKGFDPGEEEGEEEAETRLGPDGPREVPPPSVEEIVAELAEAKAKGEIPAATFSSEAAEEIADQHPTLLA